MIQEYGTLTEFLLKEHNVFRKEVHSPKKKKKKPFRKFLIQENTDVFRPAPHHGTEKILTRRE
jgi:hypothetical protein